MTHEQAMLDGVALEHLAQRYDHHTRVPHTQAEFPFLVGIIGNIGAGKTTLARLLRDGLPGSVIVQESSAHYLLKRVGKAGDARVRQLTWEMARRYSNDRYIPIVDGGLSDRGARDQLHRIASAHGVPLWFIRMVSDVDSDRQRTWSRYINADWHSSFDNCRVGAGADEMHAAVLAHAEVLADVHDEEVEGLMAIVDNSGSLDHLVFAARRIAERLLRLRSVWQSQLS